MHRFLLGCLLPLLLLSTLHAQQEKAILRATSAGAEAKPAEAAFINAQQIARIAAQEQMRLIQAQKQTYYLSSLPTNMPSVILPAFPLQRDEGVMYRGMALHAPTEELKHILKNGLEASKCNAANFAAYDGINSSWAAAAIFASTDPDLALGFTAAQLKEGDAHFPVLFHLKRVANSLFISVPHDIPPDWIKSVSTIINVGGKPLWGELKWEEPHNRFIFIPYAATTD